MGKTTKQPEPAPRGRGRPQLEAGEVTVPVTVRMTARQKDKLARLGGGAWMRDRIDKARDPES
ncbi:MAG: hypothetical protein Q8K45_07565 [Rubrivivax sp.]|nr:hypothetical protein [Rubrivivax sp.]